jgi:uridine phosphorylase
MNSKPLSPRGTPHLTPASLVGQRFSSDAFEGITIALVGFCPRPNRLDKFNPQNTSDQYFIHVPPANVQICNHDGVAFLSMAHVYGGPVSSALMEELAFYGIKYVLAYGLAGGLGTKNQKMGDFYIVEKALALDGTTPHYTEARLILSDEFLNAKILEISEKKNLPEVTPVQAMTTDAIYREYDQDLEYAKENGCDIVNCDSAHLFAVCCDVGIKTTQCGVISDVVMDSGEEWESTLSVMLSSNDDVVQNPIELVGRLAEFYVEDLMPELLREDSISNNFTEY